MARREVSTTFCLGSSDKKEVLPVKLAQGHNFGAKREGNFLRVWTGGTWAGEASQAAFKATMTWLGSSCEVKRKDWFCDPPWYTSKPLT